MNNMMPDAISPMGRAVQSKTQGMTPDQVTALDQQYAKMGLMSINDVLTLKQQLDYMKQAGQQQQAGPPPTTTVAQDMQQQMQQSGGGISSLPSNVGNAQAYSRGGIVAFAGSGLVPPYADAEAKAIYEAAERAANEAAERGVRGPSTNVAKAPWYNPKIGPTRAEAWTGIKSVARNPKAAVKATGKFAGKAAGPLALAGAAHSATKIIGTDPRYIAEAYGTDEETFPLRLGALLEDQIPFRESGLDRARAAQEADKVTPRGQEWELQAAEAYRAALAAGNNTLAEQIATEYRRVKGNKGDGVGIDHSKYYSDAGDGGLGSLAASMGLGGDPYAKANGYMGDAMSRAEGMIGAAPDRDAEIAAAKARREAAGVVGPVEDRARYQESLGELPEEGRRNKWLSAAEGFFKMAEAGGESGSTFWGAAGAGGTAGLGAYNKSLDKLEAKEERLRDKLSEVRRYEEQLAMGDISEGTAEYRYLDGKRTEAQNNAMKLSADRDKLAAEIALHEMSMRASIAVAKIQQAGRGLEAENLRRAYVKASLDPSPEGRQAAAHYLKMMEDLAGTLPQVQAAEIRSNSGLNFLTPGQGQEQTGGLWSNFRISGE